MNFGQSHGREAFGVGSQPKRNKTKQNKIIFRKVAQCSVSESRKPRPGLGTTYGSGWSKTEPVFKNLK